MSSSFSSPVSRIQLPVLPNVPRLAEFRSCYRNKKPVLFRHGESDRFGEPGEDLLTVGLSKEEFDTHVDVLRSRDNRQFLKHELTHTVRIPLGEAVEAILGDPWQCEEEDVGSRSYLRVYLDTAPAAWTEGTKKLLETLGDLVSLEEDGTAHHSFKPGSVGVWVSSAGCETPLHFDLCHGFLHQAQGTKTFLLCPPGDMPYLHWDQRNELGSKNRTTSPVDLLRWLNGDAEQRRIFPHVDNCTLFEARLSPGTTLYTPPGWWHCVISVSPSVSVLAPFDPRPDAEALPSNVLLV